LEVRKTSHIPLEKLILIASEIDAANSPTESHFGEVESTGTSTREIEKLLLRNSAGFLSLMERKRVRDL
jgi:hypothetical protein